MFHPIIEEDITGVVKELGNDIYKLEGKNILISGAAGMLASYLVYTLIYANEKIFKKNAQLYLVIRSKKEPYGKKPYIHYFHKDIAKDKIKIKIKNLHYIIHAASKAAPKIYTKNMLDTLNSNILGLYNVLSLVSKNTESILYFSSGEIYGQLNTGKPVNESYIGLVDHLNQRSCYIEGKRVCETICMNYFWEKKYPIKMVRIFHTFGPGLNLEDGRVFSDFIRDGIQGKDIEIMGNPQIVRPLLYIKDAAIMFFKILLSDKNGEIYNVSNDKNIYTVKQMADIVSNIVNEYSKKKIKVKLNCVKHNYYNNAILKIIPDTSKFKKDFSYNPTTTVKEAFKRTIFSLIK